MFLIHPCAASGAPARKPALRLGTIAAAVCMLATAAPAAAAPGGSSAAARRYALVVATQDGLLRGKHADSGYPVRDRRLRRAERGRPVRPPHPHLLLPVRRRGSPCPKQRPARLRGGRCARRGTGLSVAQLCPGVG